MVCESKNVGNRGWERENSESREALVSGRDENRKRREEHKGVVRNTPTQDTCMFL